MKLVWCAVATFVLSMGSTIVIIVVGPEHRAERLRWAIAGLWVALAFLAVSLCRALVWARNRTVVRRTREKCAQCGYDLTGNLSGVCPECGTLTGA